MITLVDRITNRTPRSRKPTPVQKLHIFLFIVDIGNPGDQSA